MFERCDVWLKDMQQMVWNGTSVAPENWNYINVEMPDVTQQGGEGAQQTEVEAEVEVQDPITSHWEMELDEGVYMDADGMQQHEDETLGPEVLDQFQWP